MTIFCKRCLYSELHPLGILIGEDGLCSGCYVHQEKDQIDWEDKKLQMNKILNRYRGLNHGNNFYDCVIPVTGNTDSFFVVDVLKNKFNMNPLLVTYNTHFNTKVGIRNLARLISELDCDHMVQTVSPSIVKRVTKIALQEFGNIYWHVNAGTQTFPVQVATKFKIPLIIWGVNHWLDQVGMFSHHDNVEMSKKVRKEHSLRGRGPISFFQGKEGLTFQDVQPFLYPGDSQLEQSRVRGLFLGNYIRWDAQKQSELMIEKYNYETNTQERTFNKYETIHCRNMAGAHDYIKFLKYGYGKATDHACRDIRLRRMTREEGFNLARKYDPKFPKKSIDALINWLEIDEKEFYLYLNSHRNKNIWLEDKEGNFSFRDNFFEDINGNPELIDTNRLDANDPRDYIDTGLLEEEDENSEYILSGRTYIDTHNYKAIER